MNLMKRFYRFFVRHRMEYMIGFVALFLLLGLFGRLIGAGWWIVVAFWIYLLPYFIYLIGRRCNWETGQGRAGMLSCRIFSKNQKKCKEVRYG